MVNMRRWGKDRVEGRRRKEQKKNDEQVDRKREGTKIEQSEVQRQENWK